MPALLMIILFVIIMGIAGFRPDDMITWARVIIVGAFFVSEIVIFYLSKTSDYPVLDKVISCIYIIVGIILCFTIQNIPGLSS